MSFWDEVIDEIRLEFKDLQANFISNTLAKDGTLTKKAEEFKRFVTALDAKRQEIDAQSIGLVSKFDKRKKMLLIQLEEDNMREDEAIAKLKDLQKDNVALNDDLLELQLRQMDADDSILRFICVFVYVNIYKCICICTDADDSIRRYMCLCIHIHMDIQIYSILRCVCGCGCVCVCVHT